MSPSKAKGMPINTSVRMPDVVIAVVPHHADVGKPNPRVAVFQRSHRPGVEFPGLLCFPGGKREDGESLMAALVRETKEEIGLDVEDAHALCTMLMGPPHLRKPVELVFLEVSAYSGKLRAREPGTSATWMRLSALSRDRSLITPGTIAFLDGLRTTPKGQRIL